MHRAGHDRQGTEPVSNGCFGNNHNEPFLVTKSDECSAEIACMETYLFLLKLCGLSGFLQQRKRKRLLSSPKLHSNFFTDNLLFRAKWFLNGKDYYQMNRGKHLYLDWCRTCLFTKEGLLGPFVFAIGVIRILR